MNNVIDYYCYILATTKVKDLNLTVSCAWRWYILINDHRLYKYTYIWFGHMFCGLFLYFTFDWRSKRALEAHTHSHTFCAWNCVNINICAMQINISHLQHHMRASKRRNTTLLRSIDRRHSKRNMKTFLLLLLSDAGSRSSFSTYASAVLCTNGILIAVFGNGVY